MSHVLWCMSTEDSSGGLVQYFLSRQVVNNGRESPGESHVTFNLENIA
jgi:hypothetical protein